MLLNGAVDILLTKTSFYVPENQICVQFGKRRSLVEQQCPVLWAGFMANQKQICEK